MAQLTIPDLEEPLETSLRERAARHGHPMEEEARAILREAPAREAAPEENLYAAIRRRFEPLGGVELEIPPRDAMRDPPDFSR